MESQLEDFEKSSFVATSRPEMNFGLIDESPFRMDSEAKTLPQSTSVDFLSLARNSFQGGLQTREETFYTFQTFS